MARTSATARARRLLVLLGMLEPGTRVPLADLARTVGVSIAEVVADIELLAMCGVAPYDPGDLVPVFVEQGEVHVWGAPPALDRKVRLSEPEARALATALQMAGHSASDTLVERLLAATSDTAPHEVERLVRTAISGDSAIYSTIAAAAAERECVLVRYLTAGTAEETERVIEPMALFAERGAWYVEAYCRRAQAVRTFRLDRMREAAGTGERFEHRDLDPVTTAVPRGELPRALVRFDPTVPVPEREWPGLRVVREDAEGTLVEVPYAGCGWIAREVVSFLGRARVLEPAEVREAVAGLAAAELDG